MRSVATFLATTALLVCVGYAHYDAQPHTHVVIYEDAAEMDAAHVRADMYDDAHDDEIGQYSEEYYEEEASDHCDEEEEEAEEEEEDDPYVACYGTCQEYYNCNTDFGGNGCSMGGCQCYAVKANEQQQQYHNHQDYDDFEQGTDYYEDLAVQTGSWNIPGTKNLVKQFEGLRLTAYQDSVGVWTIGYGHTGAEVKKGLTITQAKADQYLQSDLQVAANCVISAVKVALNPNQNGALTSFVFNLGCGAFKGSTLLRRLNAGENPNTVASQEMPKWVYAGGQKLPGLVRRRDAEVAFFKS